MLKVAFLKSRANFRGGLEKYTFHLARAFVQKGCRVTLLTTGEAPKSEDVETFSLADDSKFSFYHLVRFNTLCRNWLQKNPQDVIFGMERTAFQTHYRAGSGVHALYLQRRKLLDPFWKRLTFPLNPLHLSILRLEKKAFENPSLKILFTNSHMVKREILNTYPALHAKLEVVHNGVEWEKLRGAFEETFFRKLDNPFHFLFVGNGYRRKGLPFLLKGLSLLRNEEFCLTVIGHDKNPSFFQNLTIKLGLQKKVRFLGPQNNLIPYYQEADAVVIPSIYDPFSNVTLEAAAMGLFVVTSRYNGGHEVLSEETAAVIEELTSAESVAESLKKALSKPKTQSQAHQIRQSIKELDFSHQLDKIVCKTL